jgi:AraC-like DNA-binding protein
VAAIAALLESRTALAALRRTLPKGGPRVVTCRSAAGLRRVLETRLVDAVVLAPAAVPPSELAELRSRLPGVPVVAYAPFRPDDGDLLLACRKQSVRVAVEGVDDPVVGEMVVRVSVTAERRRALADAPRLLRLTEPLQRSAWSLLLGEVERPVRTTDLARRLKVSREHLSRQFGAGGAPNLKRVTDFLSVLAALSLLSNPGYGVQQAARLLRFSTPSHLRAMVRRITGLGMREAQELGEREVLGRFVRNGARSRV